jgi:hypothetical protein
MPNLARFSRLDFLCFGSSNIIHSKPLQAGAVPYREGTPGHGKSPRRGGFTA